MDDADRGAADEQRARRPRRPPTPPSRRRRRAAPAPRSRPRGRAPRQSSSGTPRASLRSSLPMATVVIPDLDRRRAASRCAPSWRSTSTRTSRCSSARTTRRTRSSRELQQKAKDAGPVGAAPAAGGGRQRQRLHRVRVPERGDRPQLHRAADLRLPGAGRGQRRDPPPVRDAGAEGALPAAARRRRDALVLRHDRARGRRLRPDAPARPRGARRRRLGDQRAQVVLVRRRRRGLRRS